MEPVEELNRTVRENLHDVKSSLEHIGKESPRKASVSAAATSASDAVATPDAATTSASETVTEAAPDAVTPETVATSAPGDAVTSAPSETNL